MTGADGAVAVIDFGIAKPLLADATRYTAHGSTLGTHGYLAPEQTPGADPHRAHRRVLLRLPLLRTPHGPRSPWARNPA
ncbi:hypothetical protein [Streptomyces sp. WMMB303]|uniref:hypothetical protein n=1 Tax=Streptomyces sp. WMMB303 TaxID=3034154 RepID=UPI0023ECD939|nr:hypothetical protein [Streptomyces sp. WMMB303]MDF4249602.1 hypothetical protein [Streptomyces sp. WMMB303]